MPSDNGFTELLRCPQTRQKLAVAPPALLERLRAEQSAGRLLNQSGKGVGSPVEAGLLREDGLLLYPVVDGIPVLIRDEAILLTKIV